MGAGVLSQEVSDPINARTLAKVEQMGMTMMTICSTCQGVFTQANHRLKSDPEYRASINREYLASEGLEYKGTVDVKHFLWVLDEEYGLDRLKEQVVRPLTGLKIAPFYGCYLRRPPELMVPKGFEGRKSVLEKTIEALGGEVTTISGKGQMLWLPHPHRQRRGLPGDVWQPHPGVQGKRGRCNGHPLSLVPSRA